MKRIKTMNVQEYIKQHKHKNYCEAIIYPDGTIEDAERGHVYKLIDASGLGKDIIDKMMPMFASPIHWMICYTKCISIWYEFYIYHEITNEQQKTIDELKIHDIIRHDSTGEFTDEYNVCERLNNM